MLEYLRHLPVQLMLGTYKIPKNSRIIGSYAVRDSKNWNTGVLIQFTTTGIYCLFSAGVIRSVDPKDVHRLLEQEEATK